MSLLTPRRTPAPVETTGDKAGHEAEHEAAVEAAVEATVEATAAHERSRVRRVAAAVLTTLAVVLVFLALVLPRELAQLTPLSLLRIPVELLVGVAILLVLPGRARRVVAVVGGTALGLLTLLRFVQMGFLAILAKPFDPLFDWSQLGSVVTLAENSLGRTGALALTAGVLACAAVVVVLMAMAAGRVAGAVTRHRAGAVRTVAVLTGAWLGCLALGTQLVAPVPIASRSAGAALVQTGVEVATSLHDQRVFDQEAAADTFRDAPPSELLTALRGKDVLLTYVESYGRSALENPEFAPTVRAVLDDGTRRLAADGFSARSGFLTSSVAGGGSWLAHATLLSGLRVTNQHTFDKLVDSNRLTLTSAFQRAGWETVSVMPSSAGPWPEGRFYGFERNYDAGNLGNHSQVYSGFQTPDQYTLHAFEQAERSRPDRGPLMAEIPLVSSHWPWAEIPRLLDWDAVGDGSVYDRPGSGQSVPEEQVTNDPVRMRDGYRRTIEYSLSSLISYVEHYGDDNLVLIVLGDHQPAPFITGDDAGKDVPISIITRDRGVLDRVAGWGWQNGLRPDAQAPVWPMESFRDRFLTAFAR